MLWRKNFLEKDLYDRGMLGFSSTCGAKNLHARLQGK